MPFIYHTEKLLLPLPQLTGFCCKFDSSRYNRTIWSNHGIIFPPALQGAVPQRCAEFLAGRLMAMHALKALHAKNWQVMVGAEREPCWPNGFTGSLSHSKHIAVCVAAHQNECSLLGIDIEHYQDEETAKEIASVIATRQEREIIRQLPIPSNVGITLLLSIKESLFKAFYPYTQTFMDFNTACITHIDLEANRWRANLSIRSHSLNHPLPDSMDGFMWMKPDRLLTLTVATHLIKY